MKLQLIRNATMKLTYAGKTLLTDPMLSPKGVIPSWAGAAENPTVDLPFPVDEVVAGLDAVLVSHVHTDHLDRPARELLPKSIPVFCQPEDEPTLAEAGFEEIVPVANSIAWGEIEISRTGGRHGRGEILKRMGAVSGFVLQAQSEPTVYWAGDTVLCGQVRDALKSFKPEVVILHAGGATLPGFDPIIMTADEAAETARAVPEAVTVAVHLEALDHCPVSRRELREAAGRLLIPADGETIELRRRRPGDRIVLVGD